MSYLLLADRAQRFEYSQIARVRYKVNEMESKGVRLIRFENGDVGGCQPYCAEQAEIKAIEEKKTKYPPTEGIKSLRELLAIKLCNKNGIHVKEDDIFVVIGAMNGLFSVFACLLNEGDKMIFNTPLWTPVANMAKIWGASPIYSKLNEDFQLNLSDISELAKSKPKAICINTPHNPTGSVLRMKSLEELVLICLENNISMITDEPYEDMTYDGIQHTSIGRFEDVLENGASVFTFSKSYSMTGLRIGYVVTKNKELKNALKNMILYNTNGVPTLTQYGAAAALLDGNYIKNAVSEYNEKRKILTKAFDRLGVKMISDGTYYLFPDLKRFIPNKAPNKENFIFDNLMSNGVAVLPGSFFGEDYWNHIRISYSFVTKEETQRGADIIVDTLSKLSS